MPPRLERRQQTGNLHFITFSCHNRNPYLASPRAASIFEHSLESTRDKYQFHLLGYVVMPEHVHLLLSEPPDPSPIHRPGRPQALRLQKTPRKPLLAPSLSRLQRLLPHQAPRKTPLPPPQSRNPRPGLDPSRIPMVQLPDLRHPHPKHRQNHHRNGSPMIPEGRSPQGIVGRVTRIPHPPHAPQKTTFPTPTPSRLLDLPVTQGPKEKSGGEAQKNIEIPCRPHKAQAHR
jgi:hypothetical protein